MLAIRLLDYLMQTRKNFLMVFKKFQLSPDPLLAIPDLGCLLEEALKLQDEVRLLSLPSPLEDLFAFLEQ